jgi:hypothetical protein
MAFSNSSSPRASSDVSVQGCVVLTSMAAYPIIFTMFPFENLAARYITRGHDGVKEIVWLIVLLQPPSICITDMGFSASFSRPRRPVTKYICAQRLGIRVRICGSAEQAFAWRNERPSPLADRGCFPVHCWAHGRRIAVCVLARK